MKTGGMAAHPLYCWRGKGLCLMKKRIPFIAILLVLAGHARADALEDTVRGGLLGAAAGVLVSELGDDYDARYTIPLFTGIGALTGYAVHHNHGAYYLPYLALPYAWYSHRYPTTRHYRETPPRNKRRQSPGPQPRPQPKAVDRHPGVTLIPVPVTLRNGIIVPIHILRLGERYTGPQGETYETMPDAATLQRRYAP